ncbi:hypothetical protein FOA52_003189 [Chlamydomonas sp. UWO 241]|nr:hypothetical protein FOA52_003189 [Chlamydomonas sp. UWO 241]
MASKQMKLLDLSNNPLFVLTRPDPAARLWDGGSAGGSQNGSVGSSKRGAVLSGRGGVGLTRFNHAFAAGLHNIAGHNDNGDSDCDSILYDYGWDVESAIEIFSSGLRENTALEELRLSCTSMHPDATLAVFSALAVDVDNMGARSNDVLESLDVSHNCLLKPLPVVEGAEGAATALKQQVEELSVMLHNLVALQRLNLSATFLTFEQMTVLMLGIPSAVDVNRVHDDTFLKARTNKVERDHGVVENTSLTELDLSEIPMGDKGLEEVIQELLKGNKKLRTLLLRAIGQARTVGMQALAEVLQTNQHLQVLDLSKNAGIKDEGAQKLAYALMHNNRHAGDGLLSINMSSTSLTAFGVEALCQALCQGLAAMSSLVAFDLSNSHLDAGRDTHTPREWTIAAAKAIGTVLRCNPGLRFLSLSRCHISAAGAGQLAYELDNPQYDAGNSALQHLDLGYNPLGEDGVKEIVIALQSHRQLQTLSLAAVNLTTVGLSEVLHQFERNASLEELDLTHNFIKTVNPKAFASFNANNTTLRRIDLRWNRIEESECAALGSLFTLEAKTAALATMGEAKSLRQQLRDLLNLDEEAEEAPYVLCV